MEGQKIYKMARNALLLIFASASATFPIYTFHLIPELSIHYRYIQAQKKQYHNIWTASLINVFEQRYSIATMQFRLVIPGMLLLVSATLADNYPRADCCECNAERPGTNYKCKAPGDTPCAVNATACPYDSATQKVCCCCFPDAVEDPEGWPVKCSAIPKDDVCACPAVWCPLSYDTASPNAIPFY